MYDRIYDDKAAIKREKNSVFFLSVFHIFLFHMHTAYIRVYLSIRYIQRSQTGFNERMHKQTLSPNAPRRKTKPIKKNNRYDPQDRYTQ